MGSALASGDLSDAESRSGAGLRVQGLVSPTHSYLLRPGANTGRRFDPLQLHHFLAPLRADTFKCWLGVPCVSSVSCDSPTAGRLQESTKSQVRIATNHLDGVIA